MINYILAYLRMASYSVVFISSFFSLWHGVRSVKRLFYANMIFTVCATLSATGFALNILELQVGVNWFITIGAVTWAAITFSNTVRK